MFADLVLALCAGALGGTAAAAGVDRLRERSQPRHSKPVGAPEVLVPDAVLDHFDRVASEQGRPEMGPMMARKWQALDSAQRAASRRRGRRGWRRWMS